MWGKYHMHQNDAGMSHRRRGGRWVEHPKKADLPHLKLSVQMPNYVTMDLLDEYNCARMTSECLDTEGEESSGGLVQACLLKSLYNIQPMEGCSESRNVEPEDA